MQFSYICLAVLSANALLPGQRTPPQEETVQFKSSVNVVLVPVLVRDGQGQAVEDLKKEDFQLFDRGKRQTISHFAVQKRPAVVGAAPAAPQGPLAGSTQGRDAQTAAVKERPERYIVFLFDDMHLLAGDLARVRSAAFRMLADSVTSTDAAAVVSTSGEVNSGFTRDRAKLEDAVGKLWLHTLYQHVRDCPDLSYYEANLIVNIGDTDALAVATAEAKGCSHVDGPQLAEEMARSAAQRELARVDEANRASLVAIRSVVRSMGAAPGQRTLILISPGFFAGASAVTHAEVSKLLDAAAQTNVIISALDARGLYTYMLDSSQRTELSSGTVDTGGKLSRVKEQNRHDSMTVDGAIMDELASGTGGIYFHNSNDLDGGFARVTIAPECLYLLEFSPQDAKPDGSFHRLSVKVNRKGAKVRARSGYFCEKPAGLRK